MPSNRLSDLSLALNDAVVRSRRPWLLRSYGLVREAAIESLGLVSRLRPASGASPTKFIIYGQGRTGSTLLVDLLDSHPELCCEREIFAIPAIFSWPLLRAKRAIHSDAVYGCKILGHQLMRQVGSEGMRAFLEQASAQGWRILYLVRADDARHALSHLLMGRRTRRHREADDPAPGPGRLRVPISELEGWLDSVRADRERDDALLREIPHLQLAYERDLLDAAQHQQTADRVFDYLDLPSAPVRTRFMRVSADRLCDYVDNFEEVEDFIQQRGGGLVR